MKLKTRKGFCCMNSWMLRLKNKPRFEAALFVIDPGWFSFGPGKHQMGRPMSVLQNVSDNWNCTPAWRQADHQGKLGLEQDPCKHGGVGQEVSRTRNSGGEQHLMERNNWILVRPFFNLLQDRKLHPRHGIPLWILPTKWDESPKGSVRLGGCCLGRQPWCES